MSQQIQRIAPRVSSYAVNRYMCANKLRHQDDDFLRTMMYIWSKPLDMKNKMNIWSRSGAMLPSERVFGKVIHVAYHMVFIVAGVNYVLDKTSPPFLTSNKPYTELACKTTINSDERKLHNKLRKIGVIGINDLPPDHFSLTYGVIEYNGLNFLITDRPAKANLSCYIHDLLQHNVKQVIRVCESDYPTEPIVEKGITVTDYQFEDGFPPPKHIIELFLENVKNQFSLYPESKIAIHCVAGLGRAPVLVAIALVEAGMNFMDAVEYIRHQRRGAINLRQLDFLENYKSSYYLRPKKTSKQCRFL